jgi:hypothetical protein
MNRSFISKILVIVLVVSFACVDDETVNQERSGSRGTPGLNIEVLNSTGEAVSGATVKIFATLDDYVAETNMVISATTDANGLAYFSKADLGGEAGVFYFSVESGSNRNWASTVATPYMYLTSGPTKIKTTVAAVRPEFLALIANEWRVTNYGYGGGFNAWDPANGINPACAADDVFKFNKAGKLVRREGASSCPTPNSYQMPVSVAGSNWSNWTLSTDGTTITVRDLDPDYDAVANAGLTIVAGTSLTINYGGPYIADLVPN